MKKEIAKSKLEDVKFALKHVHGLDFSGNESEILLTLECSCSVKEAINWIVTKWDLPNI